ncbi:MAG: molybdenum cofactor biosynthesis protein A [Candidatus Bathyarchaeota archaeon BA2]|nr:MAG: molybdenum cofactor biosynthesis protein A [Candidatus Bathyarchaeota archaeon BA2]
MAEVVPCPFMKKSPSVVYWLGNDLYLNITNRCSNNCYFCFRKFKDGIQGFNLKLRREPSPNEVIKKLQEVINRKNWSEVVFCGFGEPLERLDRVLEVTRWIKKYSGMIVRIDTNGQGCLLNKGRKVVRELKEAGVDKISVSLNAHEKETYNQVCKPTFENAFENVLGFIEKAGKEFDVEITVVTIPEVNIQKVRKIARKLGVGFRIREYIPCFWLKPVPIT